MFCHILFLVIICCSSLKAAPSPPLSPSPSPPPRSEGQDDTEQPPLPPLLSSIYPIPIPYSPSSPTALPPPPTARDVSPPIQYVSRNVLPLIERRPTVRVSLLLSLSPLFLFLFSPPSLFSIFSHLSLSLPLSHSLSPSGRASRPFKEESNGNTCDTNKTCQKGDIAINVVH
jgi:hypothetical protein